MLLARLNLASQGGGLGRSFCLVASEMEGGEHELASDICMPEGRIIACACGRTIRGSAVSAMREWIQHAVDHTTPARDFTNTVFDL